jgi:hypothetical protein
MQNQVEFGALIKTQFQMFESCASSVFALAIREQKTSFLSMGRYNPKNELQVAANAFLNAFDSLADAHVFLLTGQAHDMAMVEKRATYKKLKSITDFSIKKVLNEIQKHKIRKSFNMKSDGVFSQLNLKQQDGIGRSYSSSYLVELNAKHFSILAQLYAQYVTLKAQNVELIDIVSNENNEVKATAALKDVFELTVMNFFHPNSNVRIQAHAA